MDILLMFSSFYTRGEMSYGYRHRIFLMEILQLVCIKFKSKFRTSINTFSTSELYHIYIPINNIDFLPTNTITIILKHEFLQSGWFRFINVESLVFHGWYSLYLHQRATCNLIFIIIVFFVRQKRVLCYDIISKIE